MKSPGDVNRNGQRLVRKTASRSLSHPVATIWVLECGECDYVYGANAPDAWLRKCPACGGGAAGECVPTVDADASQVPAALADAPRAGVASAAALPRTIRRSDDATTLFDAYLMVDWSSASGKSATEPQGDALWLAEAAWSGSTLEWCQETYFRGRRECIDRMAARLADHVKNAKRVLVGFDFPYGYPCSFAASLGLDASPPWRALWDEVAVPSLPGGATWKAPPNNYALGTNRNNRFEVAAHLNRRVAHRCGTTAGPLYGCPEQNEAPPWFTRPAPVFPFASGSLKMYRHTEMRLRLKKLQPLQCWWVLGGRAPTVGGQILTGIPAVRELRHDSRLDVCSMIWPFETDFTVPSVPTGKPFVLHCEIWPGIVNERLEVGLIRDRAQVRAMVAWVAELDARAALAPYFETPPGLDQTAERECVGEEGWVLGAR